MTPDTILSSPNSTNGMDLQTKLEALLFFKGETLEIETAAKLLGVETSDIVAAATALQGALSARGIRLIIGSGDLTLVTAPEASEIIETIRKEELSRDISKAASETLTIILYRGPLTRSEIDFIRGVNSTFILRNLQVRGLVEKVTNPKDERSFLYKPSAELLAHMGITRIEDLPEFDKVKRELEMFTVEKDSITQETQTPQQNAIEHGSGDNNT
jgi:segregation and condensation protein B